MEEMDLIADFYRDLHYLGPGGEAQTDLALQLARLPGERPLTVADIGCGTGASALQLARRLDAHIAAVDFLPQFLETLQQRARDANLSGRITTLACDMSRLPLQRQSLDLIWSEGAIYNLGFAAGLKAWRDYLRPGGVIAVSEITWLTRDRPQAVAAFWEQAYPEIDTAAAKLRVLELHGYRPLGYFALPESCWLDNFYGPMEAGFDTFLSRHDHSPAAQSLVEEHRREIALYREYRAFYSYGFYVAQRAD